MNNMITFKTNNYDCKNLPTYEHDLCILNAGTMGEIGLAYKLSYQDFMKTFNINVLSNNRSFTLVPPLSASKN